MTRRIQSSRPEPQWHDIEPELMTVDAIADFLRSQQRPRMAGHVEWLGRQYARLGDQVRELAKRLQVYEPPPPATTPGPRRTGD